MLLVNHLLVVKMIPNDTKLKQGVAQDNLRDFENSRFNLGTIEIDELLTTAGILSKNVVTFMSELLFNITPKKVRKIVKLMPVIYLKNNQNLAFVNPHELYLHLAYLNQSF